MILVIYSRLENRFDFGLKSQNFKSRLPKCVLRWYLCFEFFVSAFIIFRQHEIFIFSENLEIVSEISDGNTMEISTFGISKSEKFVFILLVKLSLF